MADLIDNADLNFIHDHRWLQVEMTKDSWEANAVALFKQKYGYEPKYIVIQVTPTLHHRRVFVGPIEPARSLMELL